MFQIYIDFILLANRQVVYYANHFIKNVLSMFEIFYIIINLIFFF